MLRGIFMMLVIVWVVVATGNIGGNWAHLLLVLALTAFLFDALSSPHRHTT